MNPIVRSAVLAVGLIAAPGASAAMLFGVQASNPNLISIDTETGAVVDVGPLPAGADPADEVQGLTGAWLGRGVLLYTDGNTLPGVHALDPTTGGSLGATALPDVINRGGLTYDSTNTSLYSVNTGDPVVRQSGLGGPVDLGFFPIIPVRPGSLGGDDMGRHFAYGFCPEDEVEGIFEFDPAGGSILNHFAGPVPGPDAPVSGLAFDGDFLYLTSLTDPTLYTLNPDTGEVLNAVVYTGGPITALAHVPTSGVPESGTTLVSTLIGLLVIGVVGRRWIDRSAGGR